MATQLTYDPLNDIFAEFVKWWSDGFEEEMLRERKQPLTAKRLEQMESYCWDIRYSSREALATADYDFIKGDVVDDIIKERGADDLEPRDFRKLYRELLKAQIDVLGGLEKQAKRLIKSDIF